jgi:hypothetical protein
LSVETSARRVDDRPVVEAEAEAEVAVEVEAAVIVGFWAKGPPSSEIIPLCGCMNRRGVGAASKFAAVVGRPEPLACMLMSAACARGRRGSVR